MKAYEASQEEVLQSPELPKRLRVWRYQAFTTPVLFLIPILALFHVFGEKIETVEVEAAAVSVTAEFPRILRHGLSSAVELEVKNTSSSAQDLTVKFDSHYLRNFSDLQFMPATDQKLQVQLEGLQPGETRSVVLEFKGSKYGEHKGDIQITAQQTLPTIHLKTFTFP